MKRKLLTKSLLLLLGLLLGAGSVSAQVTATIAFGTNDVKINQSSVTGNDSQGNEWTITTVGTTSFTSSADYYQVGSSSKPATSITFTTTLTNNVNVTAFSAKFGGFNGTAGTVTLKVGDTAVGTGSLNATNDVTVPSTSETIGKVLTVTVTGISKGVKCYNISYTYNELTDPQVGVDETEYNVSAEGEDGTIEVTYSNITDVVAGVAFYEADGETAATYDWIDAEIDQDNNLYYVVYANDGSDARTAYLKVYALDDDANEVYSDLISITQARMPVDYATLPFLFNSGKSYIDGTEGLTQSGLGSDYKSAPLLKFDSTGDNLVLKLNEAPGTISFEVQGNSFSGGTFTVQTSVDGTDYIDLESLTGLSSTSETITLSNSNINVRYIKWIYTEKSTGNVGLGNINVTAFVPETVTVTSAGWATFAPTRNVSFDATVMSAYVVTNATTTSATLQPVSSVPAETPVLICAEPGTYALTVVDAATAPTTNLLNVSDGTVAGGDNIYSLAMIDDAVGFYRVDASVTIPAGKCYLDITGTQGQVNARAFLTLGGNTETGITTVAADATDGNIYDLTGRRVSGVARGLYIVNGKKVVLK